MSVGRYALASARGSLGYVGVALERQLSRSLFATLETHGAAQGEADGYAEFLAGMQALWPVGDDAARLGLHVALGLGGGGAINTGGGRIAKLGASGRLRLSEQLSLQLEAGRARAVHGNFSTGYAQVSLGIRLDDARPATAAAVPLKPVYDMAWALSVQTYSQARRKDGSVHSMSTQGLKFSRAVNEPLYLTGQAHSAITGHAGGYSAALMGLGAASRFSRDGAWRVGAEGLVGAAGGGNVASQGGAVVQATLWAGRELGPFSELTVGAGRIRSLRAGLSSPVIDLAWSVAFGVP